MRVSLPELDLRPEMVRENKARIKEARAAYQSALKALDGLQKANEGMCEHAKPRKCYDPGYAGGGYSHSECDHCGGTLP